MDKPVDLKEVKAKKAGEVTVKSVIDDLLEGYERNEIKSIVCVVRSDKDEILVSCNHIEQTEAVGMLECGKQNFIIDMYD